MMQLIDTHCHLYSDEFLSDMEEVVKRAKESGIKTIYLPAIDSSSHEAMLQTEANYADTCVAMMGLHPCYVNDQYEKELAIVKEYIDKRDFVAIGEIGLDFYWDKTYTEQQFKAFDTQMQWALEKGWPIVIHTRNAMQETINRVKPFAQKGLKGIFHCFSGSAESAEQITKMGFLLGIGGVITYKNNGLPQALEHIDTQYLVLETDAPYLSPVPYRGKRNESSYLHLILEKLAEVKKMSSSALADITTANAQKIFRVNN